MRRGERASRVWSFEVLPVVVSKNGEHLVDYENEECPFVAME